MSSFLLTLLISSFFPGYNPAVNIDFSSYPYQSEAEKKLILSQVVRGDNPAVTRNFQAVISRLEQDVASGSDEAYVELMRWKSVREVVEHIEVAGHASSFGRRAASEEKAGG